MSRGLGATLRSAPAGVEDPGHALLMRAAYIRQLGPGLFTLLPLGLRTLAKIEALARSELAATGAHEVSLPLVQPADIWVRSGSLDRADEELIRFEDRNERPLVLAASNEEAAAELFRSEVESYRGLPLTLFQIRRVFRDEARPRGGLLRAREFTMLDSYTFARDTSELADVYRAQRQAFERILDRLGLTDRMLVGTERSAEEGPVDQELIYPLEGADARILLCDDCGYGEKRDLARFAKPDALVEEPAPLEKVATPGVETIAALADFLSIPPSRTAKVVLFTARRDQSAPRAGAEKRIALMAMVRGDMEVSESKLRGVSDTFDLRLADPEEIRSLGAEPGYSSPVGLSSDDLLIVVDDVIAASNNLVSGANEPDQHLVNVNYGRDFVADVVGDISIASPGAPCPSCGSPLRSGSGIELVSLHRFPAAFGERLGLTFQDESGAMTTPRLSSCGMGLDRTLACLAAVHRDEHGLRLPAIVAPYQITLVSLPAGHAEIVQRAEALYDALGAAGYEVIYDDRDTSPGVKFNDADLIGVPVRLTLGTRSLERGGVELKRRDQDRPSVVPFAEIETALQRTFESLAF